MGFAEGFTQGFNAVDGAMQRRNANDLTRENNARTEAHYQDALVRQGSLDQIARDKVEYEKSEDIIEHQEKNADFTAKKDKDKTDSDLLRTNANTASTNAAMNSADAKHRRDVDDLKRDQDKRIQERKDNLPIVQSMEVRDPVTGAVSYEWSQNKHMFGEQWKAVNIVTNGAIAQMYADPDRFSKHVSTIKTGLADTNHWANNKQGVLTSLNEVMQMDIEAGKIGQTYDGLDESLKKSTVKSIKIIDVMPSKDGNSVVAEVLTEYKMPDGSIKSTRAPMSPLRSANPLADPNVREIPIAAIVSKLDTLEQVAQSLRNHPEHVKLIQSNIASFTLPVKPDTNATDDHIKLESKTIGDNGIETTRQIAVNPKTGDTYEPDAKGGIIKGNTKNKQTSEADQFALTAKPTTGHSPKVQAIIEDQGLAGTKPEIKADPAVQQARVIVSRLSNKVDLSDKDISALEAAKNVIRRSTKNTVN